MNRRLPILIVVAAGTIALASPVFAAAKLYLGDYYHPKLKAGEATIRRVIVMPPVLQMTKNTMKGGQSMEKEAEKLSPVFDRAMIRCLKDAGVKVSEASPTDELVGANPSLAETVNGLERQFDAISPVMLNKLGDVKKGRFKLGPEVGETRWDETEHSDTLLFIKGFGGEQTKAKAFATGGGLLGAVLAGRIRVNVVMTFVDANSGEVLLVKAFFVGVKDEGTEDKLVKDFDSVLKSNIKKGAFGTT
jgi:hypothetical protein